MTKRKPPVLQQQQQQRPNMPPQVPQPHAELRKLAAHCGAEELTWGEGLNARLVVEFELHELARFVEIIKGTQ